MVIWYKTHFRAGRLFLYPFKRIIVEEDDYFVYLISYIHRNPIHHGIAKSFFEWEYSSYNAILSKNRTKVNREVVMSLFGSKDEFVKFHDENSIKPGMEKYLIE